MDAIVDFQDVEQKFYHQILFQNLNFSFYPGEIIGLFAPSGSGKTTLMKMMLGLLRATSGKIRVLNTEMPCSSALQHIGYMGQEDALYMEITAREHLRYFGAMYGIPRAPLERKIEDILNFLKLSKDLHKKIGQYSGGMKKRLSLGITLLHEPILLVLDEPTVGIDPALRKIFWEKFQSLKNEGKTLVISTHLVDEIVKTDRILMLGENRILAFGTPDELIRESGCQNMDEVYIFYHNRVLNL